MWFKQNKWKVIIPVLVVVVLAAAFYFGGNFPDAKSRGESNFVSAVSPPPAASSPDEQALPPTDSSAAAPLESPNSADTSEPSAAASPTDVPAETAGTAEPTTEVVPEPTTEVEPKPIMETNPETGEDQYLTDPVPEDKPLPEEPQDVVKGAMSYTCTLSISCSTILDNMDLCDPEKKELIPEDGWILQPMTVTFYEGESVFNVLQRTCKQLKIHMAFRNTPIYNSAYIESIHNLYEFDVGELSGWMYEVNEWFPNYGCSRYQLKDGDIVNWVYTCDLGYDVGGGYAGSGQFAEKRNCSTALIRGGNAPPLIKEIEVM
jgi:hypothetical protein